MPFPVSIYDIKFYPYSEPGDDPIFAAVAEREVSLTQSSVNAHLNNQLYK
jgi:polycomb protein EED